MIPMKIALHTCHKHYIHISYCNILFTSYSIYPHYHTCLLACFTWRFDNTIMLEVHMERMYVICMQHLCTCNNVHPPYVVHTPVAIPSDWLMSHFLQSSLVPPSFPNMAYFLAWMHTMGSVGVTSLPHNNMLEWKQCIARIWHVL